MPIRAIEIIFCINKIAEERKIARFQKFIPKFVEIKF